MVGLQGLAGWRAGRSARCWHPGHSDTFAMTHPRHLRQACPRRPDDHHVRTHDKLFGSFRRLGKRVINSLQVGKKKYWAAL